MKTLVESTIINRPDEFLLIDFIFIIEILSFLPPTIGPRVIGLLKANFKFNSDKS
jgi:hypothetical protein